MSIPTYDYSVAEAQAGSACFSMRSESTDSRRVAHMAVVEFRRRVLFGRDRRRMKPARTQLRLKMAPSITTGAPPVPGRRR